MNVDGMLELIADLTNDMTEIKDQLNSLKNGLELHVKDHGDVQGHGVRAFMKPGRKKVDHEAAVEDAGVDDEIIEDFTTRKPAPDPTVAWAKITKQEQIPLGEFTTYAESFFVVEVD